MGQLFQNEDDRGFINKQGDNIQPSRTSFPISDQFVVPCPVLTIASWPISARQQKIGLKVYWAWPCPPEQDLVSPTVSLSHQEASISLLTLIQAEGRQNENHNHRNLIKLITWTTALSNSMKLWALLCRATQDERVMLESSDKRWSTGGGNGKPLQYSCIENTMNY